MRLGADRHAPDRFVAPIAEARARCLRLFLSGLMTFSVFIAIISGKRDAGCGMRDAGCGMRDAIFMEC